LPGSSSDRAGRLTRVKSVKGGATLVDHSYTLDEVGNPNEVVRAGSLSGTTSYSYDSRDRITEVCFQASCPNASDPYVRWTYDAVGNRLTEVRPTGTTSYSYNAADQMANAGNSTYAYDTNGNETQAGPRALSYDLANRMVSTTLAGQAISFSYDGDGNRTQASGGGSAVAYLWDVPHDLPQLAIERDGGGSTLRRYTYGVGRVSLYSGGTSYYHSDRLGSVVAMTSADGTSEWAYGYEPFGTLKSEVQLDPAAPTNQIKFAGELAHEGGLYYLRAREYEPTTGRFTQVDPLHYRDRRSRVLPYAYASNRPTVFVDPSGLFPTSAGGREWVSFVMSPEVADIDFLPKRGCGKFSAAVFELRRRDRSSNKDLTRVQLRIELKDVKRGLWHNWSYEFGSSREPRALSDSRSGFRASFLEVRTFSMLWPAKVRLEASAVAETLFGGCKYHKSYDEQLYGPEDD